MTPAHGAPPADGFHVSRRNVLLAGLGAAAAGVLAACGRSGNDNGSAPAAQDAPPPSASGAGADGAPTLAPTPECRDDDDVTPAQTEGPYFTAGSPERTDIRSGGGTTLLLTGTVLTTDCRPVPEALVDFWQADGSGTYDNAGFGFRGHQFTDAQGGYRLETVVPGRYPGRTRHIHVKVQAPGGRVLTTQLYFPDESGNGSDRLYREECLMEMSDAGDSRNATFTFVLPG